MSLSSCFVLGTQCVFFNPTRTTTIPPTITPPRGTNRKNPFPTNINNPIAAMAVTATTITLLSNGRPCSDTLDAAPATKPTSILLTIAMAATHPAKYQRSMRVFTGKSDQQYNTRDARPDSRAKQSPQDAPLTYEADGSFPCSLPNRITLKLGTRENCINVRPSAETIRGELR